ncbi:MAG: M15 family metallopeptidase [Lachnospiraceae bacterium]|nr:M15 family metallopeptidase [Lachnospiraceae bacterium]
MKGRRKTGWSQGLGLLAKDPASDTSGEMETLWLPRERVGQGPLVLVNRKNSLSYSLPEDQLVTVEQAREPLPEGGSRPLLLEEETARMLRFVLGNLTLSGRIVVVSGYRKRQEQQFLYEKSMAEHGEVFTRSYVAFPGCSEHETGLAVDLGELREPMDYIRPAFPYTGICQQFRKQASSCGFVERYEKEKKKITRISAEPWHFRYVGIPHANIMKARGLCLEEYLEFLKSFPDGTCAFVWQEEGWQFQISYQRACEGDTPLQVPKSQLYRISGDNQGGFIKTIWRRV